MNLLQEKLQENFRRTVKRSIQYYDERGARISPGAIWAPFHHVEAAYRSQQWLAFAGLLREAGFTDLEHLGILDVGCGTGRWVRSFLDMGADPDRCHGIDVNEKRIDYARSLSPHLDFSIFNGWEIGFPEETFDLITQFVVFDSIALPELRAHLAGEMVRTLKIGGYIFWWDFPHLAANAGGPEKPLVVRDLFPGLPIKSLSLGPRPSPGECLRPLRLIRRLLAPMLNKLAYPATHVAALIGPKPQ